MERDRMQLFRLPSKVGRRILSAVSVLELWWALIVPLSNVASCLNNQRVTLLNQLVRVT